MSTTTDQWRVNVCGGKYTVRFTEQSLLLADRYGEYWRAYIGDNLIYWLAVELMKTRQALSEVIAMTEEPDGSCPDNVSPGKWQDIKDVLKGGDNDLY